MIQDVSFVFGEQPSTTKWNYIDANFETLDARSQTGWTLAGETWTRTSSTTFTVTSDLTAKYKAGVRIRLKQGGSYKYFIVRIDSTYSSPNTTVTVDDCIDGVTHTLTAATITDNYYSRGIEPYEFPSNATFYDKTRVTKSAVQSIADSTEVAITWNQEDYDTNTLHDTATNNNRITFKKPGHYLIHANINFDNDADNDRSRSVVISDDGGATIASMTVVQSNNDAFDTPVSVSGIYYFVPGDWVQVLVFHDAGNSIDVLASRSHFSATMIA